MTQDRWLIPRLVRLAEDALSSYEVYENVPQRPSHGMAGRTVEER
jgi:hypothetical protein